MSWEKIIVWDEQQKNFLKKFYPEALYIVAGSILITGNELNINVKNKKIISLFDVSPCRPLHYRNFGQSYLPFYNQNSNLKFFSDILEVFNDENFQILLKNKRIGPNQTPKSYWNKFKRITENKLINIDPRVSARELIKISNGVINMPYTSTAFLSKELVVPTIYYDSNNEIGRGESRDISIVSNIEDLYKWKLTLENLYF